MIHPHSASKKVAYLTWNLAWQGRFNEMHLGMEKLCAQTLMATLEEVQPHQIPIKSRVILESPTAGVLSQYICGTEIRNSAHRLHKVQIRDRNCKMQCLRALIECGATTILMAPSLLMWLGMSREAAHITTLDLHGGVMQHAKDSRKTRITVQYLDYLGPVVKSDVLVVPMDAYDLILALPWFQKRHPDIDWAHRRLTSQRSPSASGLDAMTPFTTAVPLKVSEA